MNPSFTDLSVTPDVVLLDCAPAAPAVSPMPSAPTVTAQTRARRARADIATWTP